MKEKTLFFSRVFVFLLLGIVALAIILPRVASLDRHWSNDESLWLTRSQKFASAILEHDFARTRQAYHPGVITMWLGGFALHNQYKNTLEMAPYVKRLGFNQPSTLARARWIIAIVVICAIVCAYLLLRNLLGEWQALLAAFMVAWDPAFLTESRRLHTDALAAIFVLIAVIAFLSYTIDNNRRYRLVVSGLAFGLSLLSKSNTAVFLPFFMFVLGFDAFRSYQKDKIPFLQALHIGLSESTVLLMIASLVFIILWPANWELVTTVLGISIPLTLPLFIGQTILLTYGLRRLKMYISKESHLYGTARVKKVEIAVLISGSTLAVLALILPAPIVSSGVHWALTTEHGVPQIFLGKIVHDPGWLFYPVILFIRSAPLTLPLYLIGCFLIWRDAKLKNQGIRRIFLLLSIFMALTVLCQSVGAKKLSRYILVAHLVLDILAAISLFAIVTNTQRLWQKYRQTIQPKKLRRILAASTFVTVIFLQVFPVLRAHPYYGMYYNPLLKSLDIPTVVALGYGAGLDSAGEYLNQKPNAEKLIVRISPLARELFSHYFMGQVFRSDKRPGLLFNIEQEFTQDLNNTSSGLENLRRVFKDNNVLLPETITLAPEKEDSGWTIKNKSGVQIYTIQKNEEEWEVYRPGKWEFEPDYDVIYIRDLQVKRSERTDTGSTPEHVISINNIDSVWIYRREKFSAKKTAVQISAGISKPLQYKENEPPIFAQHNEGDIDFEKTVYNFGMAPAGDLIDYEFKFANNRASPVLFNEKYDVSCGRCVSLNLQSQAVPPGGEGVIPVTIRIPEAGTKVEQYITVYTQEAEPRAFRFLIKGTSFSPINPQPRRINLGKLTVKQLRERLIMLQVINPELTELIKLTTTTPLVKINYQKTDRAELQLKVLFDSSLPIGYVEESIIIEYKYKGVVRNCTIPIAGEILGDFRVLPKEFVIIIRGSQIISKKVAVQTAKRDLKILSVGSDFSGMLLDCRKLDSRQYEIVIVIDPKFCPRGNTVGIVSIRTNSSRQPLIEIPYRIVFLNGVGNL